MKYLNKSIYAFALVGMAGLWSCSQEDVLQGDDVTASGHPVPVTLTVNRGDAQTRTVLSENNEAGLTSVWEDTDVLYVYDTNGIEVGTLNLDEKVSPSVGVFSGTIEANDGENQEYNVWYYPANNANLTKKIATSGKTTIEIDVIEQNFATAADFANLDVLSKKIKLNIKGKNATLVDDETMASRMAFARFSLAGIDGKKGQLQIYNAVVDGAKGVPTGYADMAYKVTFNCGNASARPGMSIDKDHQLTLPNVEGGKDVFVAFVPEKPYTLAFVFTATDGSKYTFNYTTATTLEGGKYYNNGIGEDGHVLGATITLKPEPVEDVDHSKNPLLKWAETNLVFNTSTRTSTFATSPYDSGSLYQWGRNDGYSDYKDAMGAIGSQGNYSYGTYQGTYSAGEGWINKSSGTNRGSLNYTSASEIQQVTAAKRMYFINPYSGYDYWPFANGGNSWETRAKACNYSSESPAPTNWRLPKKSDLIEIYPTEGYNWSGTNNLADNVNGKLVEIKKISGVCTYAIRWDVETYSGKKILKIKALVVPDSYENNATDINKVDWSDSNVVERIFPATGAIEAYVHTHTNSQYQTLNVVRPIPFGNWNVSILGYPSLTNSRYWCVQYSNIVDAAKTEEGAYWISDEKMIFRFRNNNGQFGSNNTSSFFGTSNQPTSNAFAIRCVRDN